MPRSLLGMAGVATNGCRADRFATKLTQLKGADPNESITLDEAANEAFESDR